jgi:hypothetical protein
MRRVLILFAAAGASCALEAGEAPSLVVVGKYSRGACQLRLESVAQDRGSGRNNHVVRLQFQLEFAQGEQGAFVAQLPAGFYVNDEKSPLLGAQAEPGRSLGRVTHVGSASATGAVTISDIDVSTPRSRLKDVEIEIALVRVTEWDQLKFSGLALGQSDLLKCGPFEFRVIGEPQQLRINASANSQFRAEQEAYLKRIPLKFVNDIYGINNLVLRDALGRSPTSAMISGGTASKGTYTHWRPPANAAPAEGADSDDIAYPITLSLQMPKRFETERVKFVFRDIPLPAPK